MNDVQHTRLERLVLKLSYALELVGAWWATGSDVTRQWVEDRVRLRWRDANPEAAQRADEFAHMMSDIAFSRQSAMAESMRLAMLRHTDVNIKEGDTVRVPKIGLFTATPEEATNG